jgi:hypothetical protein
MLLLKAQKNLRAAARSRWRMTATTRTLARS